MSPSSKCRLMRSAGFSLIELMIAVAIAGILLAIAIPGYNSYVRQSRRNDARSALLDLAGRQERYYNTNGNQYTCTLSNLGYNATGSSTVVGNGYYSVSLATCPASTATTPSTYSITATPNTTDQKKDTACLYFYIDNTGTQMAGNSAVAAVTGSPCWSQ
jgi:type IV pilus assembly protein PilE